MAVEQVRSSNSVNRAILEDRYNRGYIETTARFLTGKPDDADEVIQNVAESLLTGKEFQGHAKVTTFLFRVVSNEVGAFYRACSAQKRGRGIIESLEQVSIERVRRTVSSAEEVAIDHETNQEIRRAVKGEPVMELRYEGFQNSEIAAMTGLTLPAVKSRVHRWRETHKSFIG